DVRDAREPEAAHPPRPGRDYLRHGGHPHGVGPEALEHADLRRSLEGGSEQGGVHALLQRDPLGLRHGARARAQPGIIRIAHVREALVSSTTSPTKGFRNIRLMWSAISIRVGGRNVWRIPPAALVTICVSTPSRAKTRVGSAATSAAWPS